MIETNVAETQVRAVLENWAKATRQNHQDEILKNHVPDLVIFDVLPPMKYENTESYREVGMNGNLKLRAKGSLIWRIYL